jgi:4-hydroxy-3-methylbut-2-enyl diphosphate reductase
MAVERALLITPRGFCAGVDRAINVVEEAISIFGAPVYVKHEIVHNKTVCNDLRAKGAVFVEEISEIPEESVCIFSAHGISPDVRKQAENKKLNVIDATCPLVTKIHIEVSKFAKEGKEILYIGHEGHPEAMGVLGIRPDITYLINNENDAKKIQVKNPDRLGLLTQTTLSIDECKNIVAILKKRFPSITESPSSDICYATTNRQTAIKKAAEICDLILVVGSKNSSNSNKLVDTAKSCGIEAHLLDDLEELEDTWLKEKKIIGISAGASAPEFIVKRIAKHFEDMGAVVEEFKVLDENMKFVMPKKILDAKKIKNGD